LIAPARAIYEMAAEGGCPTFSIKNNQHLRAATMRDSGANSVGHDTGVDVEAVVARFFAQRRAGQRVSVDELIETAAGEAERKQARTAVLTRIISSIRDNSQVVECSGTTDFERLPEIEGYDLIDEIGRGGMGVVYEAYQRSTGRRVAIKLVGTIVAASTAGRRRFEREVELVARLQHPNIVSVFDSGLKRGQYYLVMEYIDGSPLDRWVAERFAAAGSERARTRGVLGLMARLCEAVDYAHQRGVLHRDLKPTNVLMDVRGEPHVLDFGLAKPIADAESLRAAAALTIAEPGQIVGTLGYMAPEQARGESERVSVRSDVYSLGVILFELLTARLPIDLSGSLHDCLRRISEQEAPPPSRAGGAGIPADLDAIVLKALAKEPAQRYATAAELAADLRRFLDHRPIVARRIGATARLVRWVRRNRAVAAVGGIAAIALLGVGVISAVRIAVERSRAIANEKLAREKLRFALDAMNRVVFDTNDMLENVLGASAVRRELIDVALAFYETLPRDAALLGLEGLTGPQYRRLGDALVEREDFAQAARFFDLSLNSARAALAARPDDEESRRDVAAALQRRASVEAEPAAALTRLAEAIEILKRLDASQSANPAVRRALADGLMSLAEHYGHVHQIDEFQRAAGESLAAARAAAALAPADASMALELIRLPWRAVQSAHATKSADALRWACGQAESLAREVAAGWESNRVVRIESLLLLGLCAEHLVTGGELARAAELLSEARASADKLIESDPRDLKARLAAADIYACLGGEAQARHDEESAIAWFERSNAIVTPAFELQPNDVSYRRRYASTLAELAGVYMDSGSTQRAVRTYEQYLQASEPLLVEDVEQAPLRAYAWHAVGVEARDSDPARAADCFRRGLEDLARLVQRRPLNDFERGVADDLRAAAAPAPDTQPQPAP